MRGARDKENCFRIVELGIPACDVVIVGKPRLEYTKGGEPQIVIGAPDETTRVDEERFYFRILRGHTVKNLIKMREATKQVYIGFGIMGVFTIWYGQKLVRGSMTVSYT